MRRALLALVPLGAMAAVFVALTLGGGDREDRSGEGTPPSRSEPEEPAPVSADLVGVTTPPNTTGKSPAEVPGREALIASASSPQPADFLESPTAGVNVEVVSAETGKAVPHATVTTLDQRDFTPELEAQLMAGVFTVEMIFRRYGKRYRADAEGKAVIPFGEDHMVAGEAEDLWGWTELEGETELLLELKPDPSLDVRVVDGQGAPVPGAPISMRVVDPTGSEGRDVMRLTSDGQGWAKVRHIRMLIEETARDGARMTVALGLAHAERFEVELDAENLPEGPVELVMPDSAALVVRLHTGDGEPYRGDGYLSIEVPEKPGQKPRRRGVRMGPRAALVLLQEGVARFPFVQPASRFYVIAGFHDGREPVTGWLDGPGLPGETLEATFEIPGGLPALVGRLVDGGGAPLSGVKAKVTVLADGQPRGRVDLGTDELGRFRYVLPLAEDPAERYVLELRIDREDVDLGVQVDLSLKLVPGDNDLGDVTLRPIPLLAGGRVLDEFGQAIPGALVQGFQGQPGMRDGEPITRWRPLRGLRVSSDGEGRFAIHGYNEDPNLGVAAEHPDYSTSATSEIQPGMMDLVLVMRGAGSVEGRLRLDPHASTSLLRVRLLPEDDEEARPASTQLEPGGGFSGRRVAAGYYTCVVELVADGQEVERVEHVQVRAGEVSRDTRLNPIDLTGRLRVARFVVTNPDGDTLDHLKVSHRPTGSEEWEYAYKDRTRVLELATTEASLEVEIASEGYQTARFAAAVGEHEVVLEEGLAVTVVLGAALSPLPEGFRLGVGLYPPPDSRSTYSGATGYFEGTEARFLAPGPGRYGVNLLLFRQKGAMTRTHAVQTTPNQVEVQPGGGQTFTVQYDAASLETAKTKLLELAW